MNRGSNIIHIGLVSFVLLLCLTHFNPGVGMLRQVKYILLVPICLALFICRQKFITNTVGFRLLVYSMIIFIMSGLLNLIIIGSSIIDFWGLVLRVSVCLLVLWLGNCIGRLGIHKRISNVIVGIVSTYAVALSVLLIGTAYSDFLLAGVSAGWGMSRANAMMAICQVPLVLWCLRESKVLQERINPINLYLTIIFFILACIAGARIAMLSSFALVWYIAAAQYKNKLAFVISASVLLVGLITSYFVYSYSGQTGHYYRYVHPLRDILIFSQDTERLAYREGILSNGSSIAERAALFDSFSESLRTRDATSVLFGAVNEKYYQGAGYNHKIHNFLFSVFDRFGLIGLLAMLAHYTVAVSQLLKNRLGRLTLGIYTIFMALQPDALMLYVSISLAFYFIVGYNTSKSPRADW